MSEQSILSGLQTGLLSMSEFASGEVVIDKWDALDSLEITSSPYVILETADDFRSIQDTRTPNTFWTIILFLLVEFDGLWDTSKESFRTTRQAIIDKINSSDVRSAGGLTGVTIDEIRSGSPIGYMYDPMLAPEEIRFADPMYLAQEIHMDAEEF